MTYYTLSLVIVNNKVLKKEKKNPIQCIEFIRIDIEMRTQSSIQAMKPQVCWRPLLQYKKSDLLTYSHIISVQTETTSHSVAMRFAFAKLLAPIMLHLKKSIITNVPLLFPSI